MRSRQDDLRKKRDRLRPGSDEDFDALCEIRGIDAVLKRPDTVAKANAVREFTPKR